MPVAPICVEAGQSPRETVQGGQQRQPPVLGPQSWFCGHLPSQPCTWRGRLDRGSHGGCGGASPVLRYPALPFLLLEIPSELGKGWESLSESGGSVCGAWALGQVGGTHLYKGALSPLPSPLL